MITNQYTKSALSFPWPKNKKAAAMLTIDVDTITPMLWRERQNNSFSSSEFEQRAFGIRQGVARILKILDDLQIKGVFFIPAFVAEANPELVKDILSMEHEIGIHGYIHEEISCLDEKSSMDVLTKSIDILTSLSGEKVFGYRSPSWDMKPFLLSQLEKLGVLYDSSLMGLEHPYQVNNMIELPVSWGLDDAPYLLYLGNGSDYSPPQDFQTVLNIWKNAVKGALEFGSLINITVHPWITGRMERISLFKEFLSWLKNEDIWFAKGKEITSFVKDIDLLKVSLGTAQ